MEKDDASKTPDVPDDISELIEDIRDREQQRRRAFDMMLQRASESKYQPDMYLYLQRAMEASGIIDEFRKLYPEVFDDDTSGD